MVPTQPKPEPFLNTVDILHLLARGYSPEQAAKQLEVSLSRVRAKLAAVQDAWGSTNLQQTVVLAKRVGLFNGG